MDFSKIIGQFHPLLVHLPIGILLFAFVLIIYERWQKANLLSAISIALLLGSFAAALSCLTGWFLAQSGDYDAELVEKHQWTGISSCILGFSAYFFQKQRMLISSIMVAVLAVAGHFGGTITHGENYLFASDEKASDTAIISEKDTKIDSTNQTKNLVKQTFLYKEKVLPILEKKCYNCHSSRKKKGGLRLDNEVFIRKGGKNGEILKAGNPNKSLLYSHLLLPLEKEKHMPPKGKPQLTSNEISIINFWIKKGASFTGEIEDETIIPQIKVAEISNVNIASEEVLSKESFENLLTAETKLDIPNEMVLQKLKNQKIVVNLEGNSGKKLDVNFVNVKNYNPTYLSDLQELKENVFSLKINNKEFSDADMDQLKEFNNLEKLNLERTSITDKGIKNLESLKNLRQLNLYNTEVSDESIETISSFKNLKVLYLWKTKISEEGIEKLKKKMSNTRIEYGNFKFSKPDSLKGTVKL
ncbi:hypothetical protein EGI22_21930 [Lacihabitans sp. LS3-19]|nr:hypothetical protein [Lacihabitans sp. LS3-19]